MTARVTVRDWTYIAVMAALLVSYVVSLLSQGLDARAAEGTTAKLNAAEDRTVSVCALQPSRT